MSELAKQIEKLQRYRCTVQLRGATWEMRAVEAEEGSCVDDLIHKAEVLALIDAWEQRENARNDDAERCEGCGSTAIAGRTLDDVPLCSSCGRELANRKSKIKKVIGSPGGAK